MLLENVIRTGIRTETHCYCFPKAHVLRLPLSRYLRDMLNDAPMPKRRTPPPVDARLLQQIAAAGNNLNQIARSVNLAAKLMKPLDAISLQTELLAEHRR